MDTKSTKEMSRDWKEGDWLTMKFGLGRKQFYVYKITENHMQLGKTDWCNSDGQWMSKAEFESRNPEFLCAGKLRWWARIFPPNSGLLDTFCPYKMAK